MLLICPNCGAQYKIDVALIPEAGRDVQCSSCGHTWFQRRETLEDDLADEAGVTVADTPDAARGQPDLEEVPEPEPEPEPRQRPRKPDEAALAILREEAEREAEARRREAQGLETQGDLGLSGTAPGRAQPSPARDRAIAAAAAVGPSLDEAVPPDASAQATKGRDVFPDIDEINSSLSTAESAAAAEREAALAAESERSSRLGFRIGFLTVVTFVALLISLYAFAPRLAETYPSLRPALMDYVAWANARREQVEVLMQAATSKIDDN